MTSMAKYSAQQGMKNVTAHVIDVPAATAGVQAMGAPAFQTAGVNLKVVPIPPGTPDATPQVSAGLADNPTVSWSSVNPPSARRCSRPWAQCRRPPRR